MDRRDRAVSRPRRTSPTLLAPVVAAGSRVGFGAKVVAVVLVVLVPLGFVTWQFHRAKQFNIDVARQEQVGLAYMGPATRLLWAQTQARSDAVAGRPDRGRGELAAAVAAVDAVVSRHGREFGDASTWRDARAALGRAQAAHGGPEQLLDGWNRAVAALYTDIQQVSAGSNLVLDPQLDTYNLMDTATNRALLVADVATRTADLADLVATHRVGDPEAARIELAIGAGNVTAPLETLDGELDGAYHATARPGLEAALQPARTVLDARSGQLTRALTGQVSGAAPPAGGTAALGPPVAAAAAALVAAALPALDRRLQDRIDTFTDQQRTVYEVLAAGLALAAYLVAGIVAGVRRGVGGLVDALDAAAGGDLSRRPVPVGRDELAVMARALDRTLGGVDALVTAIAAQARELATSSARLSGVSGELSAAAEQTTARTGQVARAATEVDEGMAAMARSAADVVAAIDDIAGGTSRSSDLVRDGGRVVRSADVALAELAAASGRISQVLAVITGIADQTTLLSLNAAIEAARAGDAGRGFAVVAAEVQVLARRSGESVEDIAVRVEAIRSATSAVVTTFGSIDGTVGAVGAAQAGIVAAVDGQKAATATMSATVQQTAQRAGAIVGHVEGVDRAARDTREGAVRVQGAAAELAAAAATLQALVDRFDGTAAGRVHAGA